MTGKAARVATLILAVVATAALLFCLVGVPAWVIMLIAGAFGSPLAYWQGCVIAVPVILTLDAYDALISAARSHIRKAKAHEELRDLIRRIEEKH